MNIDWVTSMTLIYRFNKKKRHRRELFSFMKCHLKICQVASSIQQHATICVCKIMCNDCEFFFFCISCLSLRNVVILLKKIVRTN